MIGKIYQATRTVTLTVEPIPEIDIQVYDALPPKRQLRAKWGFEISQDIQDAVASDMKRVLEGEYVFTTNTNKDGCWQVIYGDWIGWMSKSEFDSMVPVQ